MKKNEKRMIAILIAITIVAIIVLIVTRSGKKEEKEENTAPKEEFVEVLEDGTRLNTSTKLHQTKKFEGLEKSDFQLTENGNVTLLLGTITNTSTTKQGGFPVDVKVVDKQGNEITTISAFIGPLQPGQSTQLSTNASADFANAYDFSISRKK